MPTYGTPISPREANDIIIKRNDLSKFGKGILTPVLRFLRKTEEIDFYDNEYNAFIFSRTEIEKLFADVAQPNEVIVVLLAAEKDAGLPKNPTIVLAGYNASETGGHINLTPAPGAPTTTLETPPKKATPVLPFDNNKLLLKIE